MDDYDTVCNPPLLDDRRANRVKLRLMDFMIGESVQTVYSMSEITNSVMHSAHRDGKK